MGHKRVLYRKWKQREGELLPAAEARIRKEAYDAVAGKEPARARVSENTHMRSHLSPPQEAAAAFDADPHQGADLEMDVPAHLRAINTGESALAREQRLRSEDERRKQQKAVQLAGVTRADRGMAAVRQLRQRRKHAAL